ncbi:MAG: sigma-70 family RNA polymerase sigma factor [Acidimicrobiales bacterium]
MAKGPALLVRDRHKPAPRAQRSEERRLRALQRTTAAARVPARDDEFERTTERVDTERLADRIGSPVAQLTQGDRDALILFAVEGLSYSEVAAALAVPVGTVRSRINRARHGLRELLSVPGQQHLHWPKSEDNCDG